MKMKAAVWKDINSVQIEDMPVPVPNKDEVLIRVMSCGVCVTDLHIIRGLFGYCKPPAVLGHEISGIIVETGKEVKKFKCGDRVVVETMNNCGDCLYCRTGNKNLCDYGGDIGFPPYQGGYSQYVVCPERCLYKIPDNVSFDEAAILEAAICPAGAVYRLGIRMNETVVVLGTGIAGLSFIQAARICGAGKIIAAARSKTRLEQALKFGADVAVDVSKEDLLKRIYDETDGHGADICFEAAGVRDTLDICAKLVRKNGRIILYGIPQDNHDIRFPVADIVLKQLAVYGTNGNPHVWKPLLDLTSQGKFNVKDMVSSIMPLNDIDKALDLVEKRPEGFIKAVLHPWD